MTEDPAESLLAELTAAVGGGEATVAKFYARASDRMRAGLGGAAHFGRAFGNDRYAPLLHAEAAELRGVERIGDTARGTLVVRGATGEATFVLAVALASHGERSGTWCLSGVAREGADL